MDIRGIVDTLQSFLESEVDEHAPVIGINTNTQERYEISISELAPDRSHVIAKCEPIS